MEVDKIEQAERKLAGLCPLCGSSIVNPIPDQIDFGTTYVSDCDYNEIRWSAIPEGCLDKKLFISEGSSYG